MDPTIQHPKLQEIFELLLLAGYFRVRIPSLSIFDKILGGMTWCISCSNVDIDISYSDEMTIGQKIKLAEELIYALQKMKYPFKLFPHQIQGLDYENLFPVFQWLIKFVLETREYRQDFNKNMSYFLGGKVLNNEEKIKEKVIIQENIQINYKNDVRITKNAKIVGFSRQDPLRIYSTLIEFDDKTAFKAYNKLCALISGKALKAKGGIGMGKLDQDKLIDPSSKDFNDELIKKQTPNVGKGNISLVGDSLKGNFKNAAGGNKASIVSKGSMIDPKGMESAAFNIFSEEPLNSTIGSTNTGGEENTVQTFQNVQEINEILDEEERGNFRKIERRQSKIGEQLFRLVHDNKDKIVEDIKTYKEGNVEEGEEELDFASIIKNEKERHLQETSRIKKKMDLFQSETDDIKETIIALDENKENLMSTHEELKKNQEELEETIAVIKSKINEMRSKLSNSQITKLESLTKQKNELKDKKIQIKKQIKTELAEYEEKKRILEASAPDFDENLIENMTQELNKKKEKYDKRYLDYAQMNQQIAVLQRKIEMCPSNTEIAQYHQRLIELFDKINVQLEKYRSIFLIFNNSQDIKAVLMQNVDVMRIFKENYSDCAKSKSKKEEFLKNLQNTYAQLQVNMKKSCDVLEKSKAARDKNFEDYTFLLHLEREYYKLLKELQMEYEKNEYLVEKLEESK